MLPKTAYCCNPLESRLTDLKARLHGTRPIAQQVDWLLESFRGACCALPMRSPPKRNHCGVRLCKLGTFSPVLHVTVVLLCWLCKPGIVRGALRVTIVDRRRTHPVESRVRRSPRKNMTSGNSTRLHTKQQFNDLHIASFPDACFSR